MYMPKRKVIKEVPMEVLQARNNMVATAAGILSVVVIGGLVTYQTLANRMREEVAPKQGPRVLIVGGNTAGSAVAAAVTQFHPDARVKVLDGRREQPFNGQMGHAAVGHRSYDLRTTGPNVLYASTTWTVTRDADLVLNHAASIDPKKKVVADSNGVQHEYDYLVLACGSQSDYSGVQGISEDSIDTHRVATRTHGMRDGLCSAHQGNVLTVRAGHKNEFCRSADGNFLSTVNLVYEFLTYFKRVGRGMVEYHVFTPDVTPSDALSPQHNNTLLQHWHKWTASKFHPRTRLVSVDKKKHIAHFEDVETKKKSEYPFRLMILDLPQKSPPIIEKSGLSAPGLCGFVDVDQKTLQHSVYKDIFAIGDCAALKNCPRSYGAIFAQVPVITHNLTQLMEGRKPNAEYDGYSSYHIAVTPWRAMWPETVAATRTRTADDITAEIDSEPAWPTKIYNGAIDGAKWARVKWIAMTGTEYVDTWVKQNRTVRDIPVNASTDLTADGGILAAGVNSGGSAAAATSSGAPVKTARQEEMAAEFALGSAFSSLHPGSRATAQSELQLTPAPFDARSSVPTLGSGHFWQDWRWEGWRGVAQGWYVQLFAYEFMYWFVFLRARWHPPTWFNWPEYPEGELVEDNNHSDMRLA